MTKQLINHQGPSVLATLASSAFCPGIAFAPDDETGSGGEQKPDEGGNDDAKKSDANPDEGGDDKGDGSKFGGRSFGGKGKAKDGEGDGDGSGEPADGDKPDHVPEKFWDAETKELKSDDMAKAYADLEKAHGKLKREKSIGGEVPKTADEYFEDGLELPKNVDRLEVLPDDPGLKVWGQVCHKFGIGKELAVNIATEMFGEMNQFADKPIDPEEERESLGENGEAVVEGVEVWLDGLDKTGRLSDDDADIAIQLSQTANGIRFLRTMREAAGERPIPRLPSTSKSSMSPDQFDEEYKKAVKDGDYARREELDAMRDAVFGGAAHSAKANSDKMLTRK